MNRPRWTLGDRIARARREAGLGQADLAAALGLSQPAVSKWERDESAPSIKRLVEVARITHVDLGWFLEDHEAMSAGLPTSQYVDQGYDQQVLPIMAAAA